MPHYILLTGAGFCRNWGGWLADKAFEYRLGSDHLHLDRDGTHSPDTRQEFEAWVVSDGDRTAPSVKKPHHLPMLHRIATKYVPQCST